MPAITSYPVTGDNAKAFRALNKYGMNLADFAGLTTSSTYDRIGKGGSYTVASWISDGVFANLGAAQAVYPIIQDGNDQVDWVLLQSAIDFVIYGSLGSANYGTTKRKLFVPAGLFQCNRPLQVGHGLAGTPPGSLNGNGYAQITIQGEGMQYDPSGNGMNGTTIEFPYTNNVGIAVNTNTYTHIKGFTVKGGYTYNLTSGVLDTAGVWDVANWKDAGLSSTNWIDGDAVGIGIAVDPYSAAVNAAAYPARVLPASFGGGTTTATLSPGSGVFLEDVAFVNWVIGYGRPHGDSNGEFIRHHGGRYSNCVYGIVNGHSQCRNVSFRNLDFNRFHTAFSNEGGSQGNANLHGEYQDIHAAYGYQLCKFTAGGWTGPVEFRDVYMEGAFRIGEIGRSKFTDCYFSFYDSNGDRGQQQYHIEGDLNSSIFENCQFSTYNGLFVKSNVNGASNAGFKNCIISASGAASFGDADEAFAYMGNVFSRFGPGRTIEHHYIGTADYIGPDAVSDTSDLLTFTHLSQETAEYNPSNMRIGRYAADGSDTLLGGTYKFNVPKIFHRSVSIGTASSRSGYNLVFSRYNFGTLKVDVGDVLYVGSGDSDLGTFCICTSISGSNMTLRQINNYFSTATGSGNYQTNGRTQLTTGVNYYAKYICTRIRRNYGLIMGSVMDGSNVITNVKHALGSGNAVTTTELTMEVGDYFIHPEIEMLNAGGSPVSPLNIVTAIDTTAQTITLTNDFNVTNPHYPVVFYVKVFNA